MRMLKYLIILSLFMNLTVGTLISAENPKGNQIKILLAGDSTVTNQAPNRIPQSGWGQCLGEFFSDRIKVVNYAKGGLSSKTFITGGHWKKLIQNTLPGDYVLIQFGHNDQKTDEKRHTDPFSSYQENLLSFIKDVKAKGATPILVTSVYRRVWKKGVLKNSLGSYPKAMRQLAKRENVQLIDLHLKSREYFSKIGEEKSKKVFKWLPPNKYPSFPKGARDNSHFTLSGARRVAALVVEELIRLKSPLTEYLTTNPDQLEKIKTVE